MPIKLSPSVCALHKRQAETPEKRSSSAGGPMEGFSPLRLCGSDVGNRDRHRYCMCAAVWEAPLVEYTVLELPPWATARLIYPSHKPPPPLLSGVER